MATSPSSSAARSKSKKQPQKAPVFKTASPYSAARWPALTPTLHENILSALCELISPIGTHRATLPRSKGQRQKQRDRKRKRDAPAETPDLAALPGPLIAQYVTVGFNSSTRALSPLETSSSSTAESGLGVLFITHSTDSLQYAHLPVLAAQAKPVAKIVPLENSEARICAALGVVRVGMIGLRIDAPGASALMALVDEVEMVKVPYLDEVASGEWKGVRIECFGGGNGGD